MFVIAYIAAISGGLAKVYIIVPLVLVVVVISIQNHYSRSSAQIRSFDATESSAFASLITESLAGLDHIRSFGRRAEKLNALHLQIDSAQKASYYVLALESWHEYAWDIVVSILFCLIALASYYQPPTTPACGLALYFLTFLANSMSGTITNINSLNPAYEVQKRVQSFITKTPADVDAVSVLPNPPENWPQNGNVEFRDVIAHYRYCVLCIYIQF